MKDNPVLFAAVVYGIGTIISFFVAFLIKAMLFIMKLGAKSK